MIHNSPGDFDAHNREQTEAAFIEAIGILQRHSDNFIVYIRTGKGTYCKHIGGATQVERVAIAAGVAAHLNNIIADVAIVAARDVDRQEAGLDEDQQPDA